MRAVLAYDVSSGAEQAASLVRSLPWPSGSEVHVAAVVEPLAALVPAMMHAGLVVSPEIDAQIVQHLESEVGRVVEELRGSGIAADGSVTRGRPATVLVEEAGRFAADLIVAGSRGHGSIASLVLGSVSAELVDQAPCPVLVARRPEARRVLFATDGSPSADHAEELIAGWPIFDDATVRVVSVAEVVRAWGTGIAPTMYRQVMDAYSKDLETARTTHEALARDAAKRLDAAGRTAEATLRVGDAAAEIVEEIESWQADLVVLGSRGHTGLSRIFLGSVARNVLLGSPSSVLVVRESATGSSVTPSR
jgi:nucleotide-binding universal stress UspA family protein